METVLAQVAQRPPSQWPDTGPVHGPVSQRSQLFQNAQNFDVVGGQFVSGDVHYHVAQALGLNERALTVADPEPREALALPITLQPTQAYADSEIYCNQLLQRKRGFPLYIPGPRANLSAEYRRNGISIGDVGSVTPEGAFDFFFNIYLPAGYPVNTHTPEDFVPLAPYDVIDVSQEDVAPGDYVATPFVQHTTGVGFSQFPGDAFVFHCYNPTGAVLALPHGARQEKLGNLAATRNYAAKNAESWYKYVNGTRGRELKNGTLYLVTGWEKSASWGIATFHDVISPRNELQLAFRPTADRSVGHRYRWQTCPARHKHADPPGGNDHCLNQTTFIHGFSISLGETFWQRLFGGISMCSLADSQLLTSPSDFVPFGFQRSVFSWSFDFAGSSTTGGKSRAEAKVTTSDLSSAPELFLPGRMINDWILSQTPDAKVVITHDDNWAEALHDFATATSLRTERDFLQKLAEKFVMHDDEGLTFLVPRNSTEDSKSHEADLWGSSVNFRLSMSEDVDLQANSIHTSSSDSSFLSALLQVGENPEIHPDSEHDDFSNLPHIPDEDQDNEEYDARESLNLMKKSVSAETKESTVEDANKDDLPSYQDAKMSPRIKKSSPVISFGSLKPSDSSTFSSSSSSLLRPPNTLQSVSSPSSLRSEGSEIAAVNQFIDPELLLDDAAELAELAAVLALSQAETLRQEKLKQKAISQEEADFAAALEASMAPNSWVTSYAQTSGQGASSTTPAVSEFPKNWIDDESYARILDAQGPTPTDDSFPTAVKSEPQSPPRIRRPLPVPAAPSDEQLALQFAAEEEMLARQAVDDKPPLDPPDLPSYQEAKLSPRIKKSSPVISFGSGAVKPSDSSTFSSSSSSLLRTPNTLQSVSSLSSLRSEGSERSTAVNQFIDPELLLGVSIDFVAPSITPDLLPMPGPMPNIIALPYGRCPPLHLQAPTWMHLLKLMARLSGTRIEPTVEALALTRSPQMKLRTVVQFVRPHVSSADWRALLWLTIEHPVPAFVPGAKKYGTGDTSMLPWSYTLSSVPTLLRDSSDTVLSKCYTIPSSESVPLPTLPISFPNMAMYLQAALEESRRYSSDNSSGVRRLAEMVEVCYPTETLPREDEGERSRVDRLFKKVIGRKPRKKKGGIRNEDTYELVTPFRLDEWA